jgi:hypothetical protein
VKLVGVDGSIGQRQPVQHRIGGKGKHRQRGQRGDAAGKDAARSRPVRRHAALRTAQLGQVAHGAGVGAGGHQRIGLQRLRHHAVTALRRPRVGAARFFGRPAMRQFSRLTMTRWMVRFGMSISITSPSFTSAIRPPWRLPGWHGRSTGRTCRRRSGRRSAVRSLCPGLWISGRTSGTTSPACPGRLSGLRNG